MNLIEAWNKFEDETKIVNSRGIRIDKHVPRTYISDEDRFWSWFGGVPTSYILDDT